MAASSNIVLVHGAWADGSCWSTVIERLQADGHNVTVPQLPETSLADNVARVRHRSPAKAARRFTGPAFEQPDRGAVQRHERAEHAAMSNDPSHFAIRPNRGSRHHARDARRKPQSRSVLTDHLLPSATGWALPLDV